MASGTISFNGAISGLNTTELVTQLMKIESTKLDKLNEKKDTLNEQADAWRELNSLLYTLQENVYDLRSLTMFMGTTPSTTNSDVLTATSSNGALVANYSITVENLAQAQTVSSAVQTSATTALGFSGVFTISGEEVTVDSDDTLTDIAKKINSAADSVYASVIQTESGKYQLAVTNRETGTANAATFSYTSGDNVLESLGIIFEDGTVNVTQAAENAKVTFNGITVERATNTITDAITGVTLTLKDVGSTKLSVAEDKDAIVEKVKSLVESYNAVMDFINENTTYTYDKDTKTGSAGPLFGDSTLSYIQSTLKSYLSKTLDGVDANFSSLVMIGISSASGIEGAKSNHIAFDEATFRKALDANYDDVGKLFGSIGGKGVFSDMYDQIYKWTSTTGMINDKTDTIDSEIEDLNDRIEDMKDYLKNVEERYYTQFTNMELALAKLKSQTSAITALLSTSSDKS